MQSVNEVLVISETGSESTNCTMFDLQTGSLIEAYKEGHTGRHAMDFIRTDFLISALKDKPKIKIWQFGQPANNRKMTTPGIISALAVSSSGDYCVAGIGRKTYIWEIFTGDLESVLEYHYQDITCVRLTSEGSFFITGGKDGHVYVYSLHDVLSLQDSHHSPKATFSWQDHADEVTDIHVGCMSRYSNVASVSKDMTCRIYSLLDGNPICTIHVNVPLTSVTIDKCEYFLFLGCTDGNIYKVNLFEMESEMHIEEADKDYTFIGHKKEITSLKVVNSGQYLVSGSADHSCRIWEIANLQNIKKLDFSGPVTNVMTSIVPPGIKNENHFPRQTPGDFKKVIYDDDDDEPVPMFIDNHELALLDADTTGQYVDNKIINYSNEKITKILATGSTTQNDLIQINNEIYAVALNDYFERSESSSESDSD